MHEHDHAVFHFIGDRGAPVLLPGVEDQDAAPITPAGPTGHRFATGSNLPARYGELTRD